MLARLLKILHTEVAHQSVLVLLVEYVYGDFGIFFGGLLFFLKGSLYGYGETIFVVGQCGVVCTAFYFV